MIFQAGKPENTPDIIDDFDDNVVEEAVTVRIETLSLMFNKSLAPSREY